MTLEIFLWQSGIAVLFGSACIFALRESFKKLLHREAQKDINKHKHELEQQASQLGDELQRKFAKFEFHLKEQGLIYPEIYRLFKIAEGMIGGLYGGRYTTDVSQMKSNVFIEIIRENNFLESQKKELIDLLSENKKNEAIEKYKKLSRDVEFGTAHEAFREAKNYYTLHELFVSKNVDYALNSTIDKIAKMWGDFHTCHISHGTTILI